jgi:hypothetical protein
MARFDEPALLLRSTRVRLSLVEARALSGRAMRGIGYEPEDARILADHALDAALCGYEYSGAAEAAQRGGAPAVQGRPRPDARAPGDERVPDRHDRDVPRHPGGDRAGEAPRPGSRRRQQHLDDRRAAPTVNPRPPAPVSCRTATIKRIADTTLGALVRALPGRMPAANSGTLRTTASC